MFLVLFGGRFGVVGQGDGALVPIRCSVLHFAVRWCDNELVLVMLLMLFCGVLGGHWW